MIEINSFFQNIRREEYERINKKRRMQTDQSEESWFRNDNNQLDEPQASQPMSWSHGKKKRCVLLNPPPWKPGRPKKFLTSQ